MSVADGPLLAVDAGSPRVSVAVGDATAVLAEAVAERERSSSRLLAMIDRVLAQSGIGLGDLAGLVALRGPGSFTGLRVGLATVLGLHQAGGLPATALPTLEILATLGPGDGSTVVAAVDALRREWFVQPYRSASPPRSLAKARLLPAARLGELGPCLLAGFGVTGPGVAGAADLESAGVALREPPPLAGAAVLHAGRHPPRWETARLIDPLYLRPPAAVPNAGRRGGRTPARP